MGPHGEAVIDLVASDARRAGFGTIVLVLGPDTGPASRYHVEHVWPAAVEVAFAYQAAPLGTVDAVLSASDHVGDAPYGVGNADDIYGLAPTELLAELLQQAPAPDAKPLIEHLRTYGVRHLPKTPPPGGPDGRRR